MEGTPDAGSKVKDERSDEDDITVVEDEDEGREKEAGGSSDAASTKNKDSVDQEGGQSADSRSNVFDYGIQGVLDDEMSPLESRQDSHSTNVDSDVSGFQTSLDQGLDQGGWSWNKESEHGSREMMPASKGTVKVRRFQCGICGTNFTLLKNAKRHYRCQHLNYYYWCKYCPNGRETRRYTRREFLEDHFLSHHPEMICEVAEVGKSGRTDEYNIVCVDIYEDEEEEEEVGLDVVTTSDAIPPARSTLEPASSRGAFEGSLLLQHAEQRENMRSETNARGNYINLADYHGFANDSHLSGSNSSGSNTAGSVLKRMQQTSPVNEQSNKVRRIENERSINLECDMSYSDGILHERDVSQGVNRWVSPSGQSLSSRVNINVPNQSALTTSRSQCTRQDGSYSGHPMLHDPAARAHDCLVIGSAITPLDKDTTLAPSPSSVQPSTKHASPQMASSSTRHPQSQNTHQQPKRQNHLLPNQRQHTNMGNASDTGRNITEEGNIVISSSDTTCRKQRREARHQQRFKEVVVTEGDAPATNSLSCKEILEKYHHNISKYSKEIECKYDSSGRVVRRKIVKHVFVFSNSQSQMSRGELVETQAADRSASR
ncbi:uncharacterized protein LOC100888782 isoform X2 [Strongylocentrotus purpuratus]|uniref:C2H2-type domain-containing protein n=1 Tax=Strongylocentrotus purpuratus TaxID=7668 RepID=A0A7M7LT72_STRPU|nr:uncharacterized protein LOC100888782 isoform X2 [Strongylocentrotus purpuratus]|eukprot:XP_011671473.1 PREDICTED: uncharacterized protein LOC100888782 isoform X2 [Strongylocentrotus purpuratus]